MKVNTFISKKNCDQLNVDSLGDFNTANIKTCFYFLFVYWFLFANLIVYFVNNN